MKPVFFVLLALLWSPNLLGQTSAWAQLTIDLTDAQQAANIPAMGVVIMDQSQPAVVAVWGDGISIDTPFRWGSISKTFTALGLLRLVEQGHVALTDRVRHYLPTGIYENPWAPDQPLRLLHLLELTGGFGDISGVEFTWNEPLTLHDALALNPSSRTNRWPPGLQHSYTNINPGITAAVIERVTGKSFESFMKAEVLTTLDMQAASFHPVPGLPGGFKADGTTEIPYWHVTFRAFGGLNASVAEMSRFLTMLLNHGQLGTRTIFARKTLAGLYRARSGLAGIADLEVSYGSGAYGRVSHGHVFYGHGGDADGYRSRYAVLPDAKRGYLIVINTDNPAALRGMQQSIERALTADLPTPVGAEIAAAQIVQTHSALSTYAGDYYPASARFNIKQWRSGNGSMAKVSVVGTALLFARNGRRVRLIPLGSGKFRRPGDPLATVIFATDNAGTLYLQGELGNFVNLNSEPCPGFIPACDW